MYIVPITKGNEKQLDAEELVIKNNKSGKPFSLQMTKRTSTQWFFGGPKLGKKSRKFQQISDTKSCGYVRNLVRFGVNVISFEEGGRWFSLFDRILVFGLNKESKAKFSPTFCHLQRKSSCHMEFLAIFSLAILSGK